MYMFLVIYSKEMDDTEPPRKKYKSLNRGYSCKDQYCRVGIELQNNEMKVIATSDGSVNSHSWKIHA